LVCISLIPVSAAPIGPSSLDKALSIAIKEDENPLITLTGIPIPGGTEVGIGSALIVVTTVFNVGITWFKVDTSFEIVSIGLRIVFKAPVNVFLTFIFSFNKASISSKKLLILSFCWFGSDFKALAPVD